jgi:Nucleoside 2-deoxyribosyltransferase
MRRPGQHSGTADIIKLKPQPPESRNQREADIGRGQAPRRMRKPVIYFAGRMRGAKGYEDWRDGLGGFEGLYATKWDAGRREFKIDCDAFWFGGPFVLDRRGGQQGAADHQQVWQLDQFWIERADLIFAYIDDLHAHGTLVEIGYAAARGKPVALAFSRDMARADYEELWLARMLAVKVYLGTPQEAWQQLAQDWIAPE